MGNTSCSIRNPQKRPIFRHIHTMFSFSTILEAQQLLRNVVKQTFTTDKVFENMNPLWDKNHEFMYPNGTQNRFQNPGIERTAEQIGSPLLPVFYFAGFEFEWRLELALFRQGLSKSINCPVKLNHPNVMKSQSQIVIRRSDERYFSFQTTDFLQIRVTILRFAKCSVTVHFYGQNPILNISCQIALSRANRETFERQVHNSLSRIRC